MYVRSYTRGDVIHTHTPLRIDLVGDFLRVGVEHVHDEWVQELAQVALAVDLEAERHDLAGEAVAAEERLHAVGDLHLFGEHVPQQLIQQVLGVEQVDEHTRQLVLSIKRHT